MFYANREKEKRSEEDTCLTLLPSSTHSSGRTMCRQQPSEPPGISLQAQDLVMMIVLRLTRATPPSS